MRTILLLACFLIAILHIPANTFGEEFHWAIVYGYDWPLPSDGYFWFSGAFRVS
jgi:hypothetical protein